MINVYSENTTNFNNNGLATLIPLTAEFSSDINGAWTLSITHPYDAEERYKHLVKNAILQADVGCIREQSSKQLFRIYDVKKNLQSLSIIAFPIGMEATFDAPIEEIKIPNETGVLTASGVDAAAVLDNYVKTHDDNNKYTVSSNVATQSCSQWENSNLIAAISGSDDNAFINKWGGEVLYNNYAITIKNRIGNASPEFPVEYGKNLTGMEHNLDMSTVITRAYPLSTDGLRLHQYDDLDIDYWYGTFDGDQKKNYAKSQYLYNYNDHTWYQFDSNGKLLTDPIPAEMLAILDQFDWHENETGWWYGLDSTYFISNAWVEDANGKHYWMDSQGYMDSQYTDTDVWTWNQFDDSGEHYGEKRNSFVDSDHKGDYPYIRSAFLNSSYELLDTDSKSNSLTAQATRTWTEALYDAIEAKAEELWNTVLTDTTNTYCTDYLQELIDDIVTYTQARYVYSHKGWQSLIKSLIKSGIEWIKDEELDEEGWIEVNGYMYGDFDNDGNFLNYPKSQYLYCYSESKWYYFEADGLMSTDEIPAETIALLNTYDWHTDSTGTYYGDGVPGSGNYMKSAWIENSDGTHSWVGADGYYDAQWDDSTAWDWTEINGWRYGRSSTQYVRSCYVEIDKNLEYFGADGFWRDWMRVPAEDMGWYQVKDGANAGKWWYGSLNRYYAHNEFVYVTVDGTMEEWWYDKEGWYDADSSGASDFDWHGDSSTGIWFGEEDAGTGDKNKYIHDKWAYIDGTYYWFDSDGYISGDASKAKQDWAWGDQVDEVTGKHWFGNTDESFNRMWLASQYMKLDNEWYFFDSDGYMIDRNTKKSQTISWFSTEIVTALNPVADLMLKAAYDLLYTQMTTWVQKQFEDGLDKPQITVSVNLVDLSKTSEYAEYADLEKIYLGDSVRCVDTVHGMSIDARVVGLTYDLIRGYNTKVTIGQLAKNLSQILSVSYQGSDKDTSVDNIIAGDGVKKDGNVISATGAPGTSYGLQDVIYEGASLVSGNVAVLDDVIPEVIDVVANPEAEATDDLIKLKVGDVIYQILGGGGSGNINYGYDAPTGGADKDAYFQLAHGYADLFEVGTQSSNIVISDFERGEDDTYSYTTSGYANLGNDDAQMIIDGLIIGNEYKISFDFQFDNQTTWIGGHVDTAQVWVHGTSSDWGDNSVVIESGYNKKHYEITFTAEIKDGTVFALCFNNCTDGAEMLGYVTNLVIDGEFDRQYDTDYDTPYKLFINKSGIWREYIKYSAGDYIEISEDGVISAIVKEYIAGANIDISNDVISGKNFVYKGTENPVNASVYDKSVYLKYTEDNTESSESQLWTGSVSTTSYFSPVRIGDVNPTQYYHLRIVGTFRGNSVNSTFLVSDLLNSENKIIKLVGDNPAYMVATGTRVDPELYDDTSLWLYVSSGYTATATAIYGTTNTEVPQSIDEVYGNIGGYWFKLPGGGTEVVANPSGTATDTLNTVQIDDTIYSLPSGGGGSGYTEDVLWNTGGTTSSWASPLVITLNENISDYDAIRISFTDVDGNDGFVFIPTSEIPSNYANKYFVGAGDFLATVKVNSDTQISCYAKNGITMTYNNVIGISYGSGGSSGSFIMDKIWTGPVTPTTSGTTITLTEKWSDYDALVINIANGTTYYATPIIMTSDIEINKRYIQAGYSYGRFDAIVTFLSDTSVKIERESSGGVAITYEKIYGLKFGGSGGGGSSEINYSTEEQRIGTWIDGKPLYQKTIEVSSISRNVWNSYLVDANAIIRYIEGWYADANNILPLGYYNGSVMMNRVSDHANGYISIYGSGSITTATATVRYTKTTD